MKTIAAVLLILLATGCATGPSPLGESTTISPGWAKLKQAATEAVKDPHVWAPVAAAAALQINDYDTELSDHLREETPLFGSTDNASDMSDQLRDFTQVAQISTALLAVGPEDTGDWLWAKSKLLVAEHFTIKATSKITSKLKHEFGRERPNAADHKSMPSGHTSKASVQASMAQINIQYLPVSDTTKQVLDLTMTGSAALTGWARVEGGWHYPSDVLIGYALGRFMGHIGQAFILPDQPNIFITPLVTEDTTFLQVNFAF
jgi:hypothetical protein